MVRLKNRYYLCEIIPTGEKKQGTHLVGGFTERLVFKAVQKEVQDLHGDYGQGVLMGSFSVSYLNPDTNMVMIRAGRDYHRLVGSALPLVKKIGHQEAFLRTIHLGGTIRSCQKFLIKHNKQFVKSATEGVDVADPEVKEQGNG
ncbi:ribonuclease P/MRP protein subunit POP5 [Lingula anatina]|uniref:Ribonuclease P/MRP protein subunit POP5 n=1 Tax=Lingula anatina TaxID=7574 RepID=A0A1S3HBA8_LINAN|nr:ribonuclease P/MRP protein subunit POP5 [Lingula anatina]|eukprot:XP_013383298.1 ribonuclease P/MRP protein subunit POP5 [Lingula anatina]